MNGNVSTCLRFQSLDSQLLKKMILKDASLKFKRNATSNISGLLLGRLLPQGGQAALTWVSGLLRVSALLLSCVALDQLLKVSEP